MAMRALVSFTLQRNLSANAERDLWAIRRTQPVQVNRLASCPLVFIYLSFYQ